MADKTENSPERENIPAREQDLDKAAQVYWDEFEEEETGRGDKPSPEPEPKDEPHEDDEDNPPSEDDGDQPPAEKAAGEEPEKADDPWAKAPPELRTLWEQQKANEAKLQEQLTRERGRTSALQRRIDTELRRPAQPPKKREPDPEERARLDRAQEEYPDIVRPVMSWAQQQIEELQGKVTELTNAEQQRLADLRQSERDRLLKVHPDYREVTRQDPDAFIQWVEDQPLRLREAAWRNAQGVMNADEAAEVIAAYKQHLGIGKPSEPAEPKEEAPPEAAKPQQLSDKRRRQLDASSSSPARRGTPTVTGIPKEGDAQAIWDAFEEMDAREEEREARRRYR